MASRTIETIEDVRAFVASIAETLDPSSRYISELVDVIDEAKDVADLDARLTASSRGNRFAGADVFVNMSIEDKLRSNLITPETSLFRFAEGEIEASRAVLAGRRGQGVRVLIVPCSHGEEAFTMAAFLLAEDARFSIRAFDIQSALIEEARSGRLTFGYPVRYLQSPGFVGASVLERISFELGDAFQLPLEPDARFDLVLCRNFLGYFVADRAAALTAQLAGHVAPGGRLFLDKFCLAKMPEVSDALAAADMSRVGDHPVFAAPSA